MGMYKGISIFQGKDPDEFYSYWRLKGRLNPSDYNGQCDSCVNGFLFGEKDFIMNEQNSYYRSLFCAPEIITDLGCLCQTPELMRNYMSESTLYLISFEVDIKECVYDQGKCPPLLEKVNFLCSEYLNGNILPDENPIIRLPDNLNISKETIVRVLQVENYGDQVNLIWSK